MSIRTQVNSATGVMGPTGSGKSSLAATLADYLWANWQKVLLLYNSDGGGFPAEVQARVALGTIRVFRMRTRDPGDLGLAPETCYRAAQGWWPKRIKPSTGEVEPGCPMLPPIAKYWEQYCPNGHLAKSVVSQSLLTPGPCPTCNQLVTAQNMQVKEVLKANKGFEDVGGVFYDGLTSMLSWQLMELGQRAGKLELKGEEGAIGGKVISGDMRFGGVTRSHVGFAQTRGEELVHLTLGIPNLLVPPVFTMLTHEDVDDRAMSIRGPKIAGRAKTDEAGQWFGNMLEAGKVPALTGPGSQFTLFLDEFTDGNGVKHLIKHRGSPGTMPSELRDPVEGPPFSEFNLGRFFFLLDAALTNRISEVAAAVPGTPGVVDGWVEIAGTPGVIKPAVPTPPTTTIPAGQTPPSTVTEPGTPVAALPSAPPAVKPRTKKAPVAPPAAAPPAAAVPTPPTVQTAVAAVETMVEAVVEAALAPEPVAPTPPAPQQAAPVALRPVVATQPAVATRPVAAPPPGRRPQGGGPASPGTPAIPPVATGTPLPATAAGPPAAPPASGPRPPTPAPRPIVPPATS